jgi:hypothetical protein
MFTFMWRSGYCRCGEKNSARSRPAALPIPALLPLSTWPLLLPLYMLLPPVCSLALAAAAAAIAASAALAFGAFVLPSLILRKPSGTSDVLLSTLQDVLWGLVGGDMLLYAAAGVAE